MTELTGGRAIMVYGQHEVVRDLIEAAQQHGQPMFFNVSGVSLQGLATDHPRSSLPHPPLVAGCDGFHGISRGAIPAEVLRTYERVYPYAWLGILADAPPSADELIYAHHERGFALFSMRSPSVTRLYLQCDPDEKTR